MFLPSHGHISLKVAPVVLHRTTGATEIPQRGDPDGAKLGSVHAAIQGIAVRIRKQRCVSA